MRGEKEKQRIEEQRKTMKKVNWRGEELEGFERDMKPRRRHIFHRSNGLRA